MRAEIKTWREMEGEFQVNQFGTIRCNAGFTEEQNDLLPTDRIIKIEERKIRWGAKYFWKDSFGKKHPISLDIVKKVIEK